MIVCLKCSHRTRKPAVEAGAPGSNRKWIGRYGQPSIYRRSPKKQAPRHAWRSFARPLLSGSTPEGKTVSVDRNTRTRLVFQAEAYERRTKLKGKRGGNLMPSGVQLLRCIAFTFLNLKVGAAWPSYTAFRLATGLCRQTLADAIERLEETGSCRCGDGRAGKVGDLSS